MPIRPGMRKVNVKQASRTPRKPSNGSSPHSEDWLHALEPLFTVLLFRLMWAKLKNTCTPRYEAAAGEHIYTTTQLPLGTSSAGGRLSLENFCFYQCTDFCLYLLIETKQTKRDYEHF